MTYEEFLKNKIVFKKDDGFEIDEKETNELLKENILNSAEIVQYLKNKYIVLKSISTCIDRRIVKSIIEERYLS